MMLDDGVNTYGGYKPLATARGRVLTASIVFGGFEIASMHAGVWRGERLSCHFFPLALRS